MATKNKKNTPQELVAETNAAKVSTAVEQNGQRALRIQQLEAVKDLPGAQYYPAAIEKLAAEIADNSTVSEKEMEAFHSVLRRLCAVDNIVVGYDTNGFDPRGLKRSTKYIVLNASSEAALQSGILQMADKLMNPVEAK